jgi:outer membrane protein assembly factor BamB
MQILLKQAVIAFTAIVFPATSVYAQIALKQIINIPWGTEDDRIDAMPCKTPSGSFIIASTLVPNHESDVPSRANLYRQLSLDGRTLSQFHPKEAKSLKPELLLNTNIYLTNRQNAVYRCQSQTSTIDSIRTSYTPFSVLSREYKSKKNLLVTGSTGYYFYDAASLKLLQEIPATKPLSTTGKPSVQGDRVYCLMQENQLASYDLAAKKTVWSVTTTPKAAKWLGITVGTFDDVFIDYALNNDGSTIYATTVFGCLYKINAATGAVLKQVDRFRGEGNNAGLIGYFAFADVNNDGVEDMIGSSPDYNIYAINGKDLSVIWAYNTGDENQRDVALYDITGDGIVDVFTVNNKMKLSIINGKTGMRIHEFQIQPEKGRARVILADINGNGLLDIFIFGGSKAIRAYEMPAVKVSTGGVFWMTEGLLQ